MPRKGEYPNATRKGDIGESFFDDRLETREMVHEAWGFNPELRRVPSCEGGRDRDYSYDGHNGRINEHHEFKTGPGARLSSNEREFQDDAFSRGDSYDVHTLNIPRGFEGAFYRRRR